MSSQVIILFQDIAVSCLMSRPAFFLNTFLFSTFQTTHNLERGYSFVSSEILMVVIDGIWQLYNYYNKHNTVASLTPTLDTCSLHFVLHMTPADSCLISFCVGEDAVSNSKTLNEKPFLYHYPFSQINLFIGCGVDVLPSSSTTLLTRFQILKLYNSFGFRHHQVYWWTSLKWRQIYRSADTRWDKKTHCKPPPKKTNKKNW